MTRPRLTLRQTSTGSRTVNALLDYELRGNQAVIGREADCQIPLDSQQYPRVSRHHALLRQTIAGWEVCDLDSANGTYLNGHLLADCQAVYSGDRLTLGYGGPEFHIEITMDPGAVSAQFPVTAPTFTQLFPLISTSPQLRQKAYLLPVTVTVTVVVLLFAAVGEPNIFNPLLASYLACAAYFFVYRLCGKPKPWWMLCAIALGTVLLLLTPLLSLFIVCFRQLLPGQLPQPDEAIALGSLFGRMFIGTGLLEELFKALPLLALLALKPCFTPRLQQQIGIHEPLDGILYGAASAVGFTLMETLGQYVPETVSDVAGHLGEARGQLWGLQLLIPRIIGSVSGHMAYSGYLGYFIGLSVLNSRQRWQTLSIGYFSAAFLHTLWNIVGYYNGSLLVVVGLISYSFLATAILKARSLSPTRNDNFATQHSRFP